MTAGPRPTQEFLALQAAVTGRYVLDREIGRGGMGVVFLARDVALDRPVAIKLLLPHLANDHTLRERFLREAQTAAQLLHPNIVPIYAVEARDDFVWFVMAFIAGETLTQRVRRTGPLSPDAALSVLRDVAWALAYAHGRGVIHRDIKPDNILLESESGRALVADFGIARVAQRDTLSDDGAFVGTADYMSREQASALAVDGRTDVYSLGATLYFALLGESPVQAASLPAVLGRLMREDSPNLALLRPDLPASLADVLSRALVREADGRIPSAEALVADLRTLDRSRPLVRPEIKVYLSNFEGTLLLGGLSLGFSAIAVASWEGGILRAQTRDGFLVIGLGLVAMVGVLVPLGLLTLRDQAVTLREVVDGLEAEGRERLQMAREQLRRAFQGKTSRMQLALRWTGGLMVVFYGGFAYQMAKSLLPRGLVITFGMMLSAAIAGAGFGGYCLWRGFQRRADFERIEAATRLPVRYRILLWLSKQRATRWWFNRAKTPALTGIAPVAAPTATLLLQRVEDLVAQLPDDVRRRLPDVLPAAASLERACAALRTRLERLDAAAAELPVSSPARSEFKAARDRLAARLADGLTGLETLRTDLLRMSVGLGAADGLTLALEKAQELGAVIDAELHGQAEVKKLLG